MEKIHQPTCDLMTRPGILFAAILVLSVLASRSAYSLQQGVQAEQPAHQSKSDSGRAFSVNGGNPPTVTTLAATFLTSTGATLNGLVTRNGLPTGAWFEWGTSSSYTNTAPSQSVSNMAESAIVSEDLGSLSPNTSYHYRAVAGNSLGVTYGNDVGFTTEPSGSPPTVSTGPVDSLTSASAKLGGTINPNGLSTVAFFQWGISASYGNTTPPEPIGGGTGNVNLAVKLNSLSPNTTYHFRVVASNSAGATEGSDATFTTLSLTLPPTVLTSFVTNVTVTSAQLNGTVNPNGSATVVHFEWGTSALYGNTTPSQSIGSETTKVSVSESLTLLSPNTKYYCRLVASNSAGTIYGDGLSFTTGPGVFPVTPIALGETVTGTLSSSDSRSRDRGDGYFADHYYLSASAGQPIVIFLTSADFDTYLYLFLADSSVMAADDNGGGGTNSRIPSTRGLINLPTNSAYVIEVTSSDLNRAGAYTLSLSSTFIDAPPIVTTGAATSVSSGSATLNGSVNPNGFLTAAWFEIGTSASLASFESTPAQLLSSGTTSQDVNYIQSNLASNAEYFYRIVAQNIAGVTRGSVKPFTTVTSVDRVNDAVPTHYDLSQNSPNPFNPTTSIEFSLPKSDHVVLMIYNLLGNQVGTLVDGVLTPGTYRRQWHATHLPSGVYFYRLVAGSFVETKKMLLLR